MPAEEPTSERQLVDEALRDSTERYQAFISNASEGIWRFELEQPVPVDLPEDEQIDRFYTYGYLGECNDAMARMYGHEHAADIVGARLGDMVVRSNPDNIAYLRNFIRSHYRLTDAESQEVAKDGTPRWFLNNFTAVLDNGRITRAWGTQRDITEVKRAQAAVQEMNRRLEQKVEERTRDLVAANKELEAFCYAVSHDLRTPLRALDGFSREILENAAGRLDSQSQKDFARIRAAAQRMDQIIEDLLRLSRISQSEVSREKVLLSDLVETILKNLRVSNPERQVESVIAPELWVEGDSRLLRIALENLLGNAWKFTEKRPKARIEFGILKAEGQKTVFVKDNGAGFDMKYADQLFHVFKRLHGADEFAGNGIGLATVQRIIHRHGGRIWAEAKVNAGATFYFTLPD